MKVKVRINGSSENPWNRMGMRANPFPQIAKAEWAPLDNVLRELDAAPVPDEVALVRRIYEANGPTYERYMRAADARGDSPWLEFVAFCKASFKPGERTTTEMEVEP